MDNRTETRDFLSTRRAKITPEQAGLAAYGGNRRVPGLRRGEVAILAGVSVEYYTRLERGNLAGVSESVLESLANALQLDDAERAHLYDLARAASEGGRSRRRPVRKQVIRPGVQLTLDAISGSPAFIRNGRLDLLATNALGRALYSDIYDSPAGPPNHARFLFLDPRSRDFYTDWERAANDTVAIMRTEAGRDPYDRGLSDLVGELSTRSEEFRVRWASHNVRQHYTGKKHFRHRIVGDLHLLYEALELSADAGLTLTVYNAEPGTGTADALQLLASWAATTLAIPEDAGDLRNIHNT
ncbi:transcriptional regulator [Paenarthrobacter nitroguajacolicus]|uniref:helix-turn-helix transcriptional regulator n=1 Tax=Paenarthrobacter nitroguajacolicus TaxID=211146 RepID=UPI0015B87DD9|nr:helix-turn-helix transcriptional regulator [Paenarthrobacter nitroguajacolicus]NWL10210.1 transcriptional regulator [Paenarthrobacter nitroguajacolicus]